MGDRTVVHQEIVGNSAEALARWRVVGALGLGRAVAAGQDDRSMQPAQRQVMQRRARQHEPERRDSRGDAGGHRIVDVRPSGHDHDRRRGTLQQCFVGQGDEAIAAHDVQVARHQCERLALAMLALSQPRDRGLVGGVAGELEPAQALEGDDLPALHERGDRVDGIQRGKGIDGDGCGVSAFEPGAGPAGVAGDRLGVKAPVVRVVVFAAALRAVRKRAWWWRCDRRESPR